MADKKQHLFLFSIGPVQSFIAQARKTQDLYAGSKILSELAKEGLTAANPKEFIFPNSTSNESVPNRFLCLIDNEDPKQLGIDVEQAVQKHWKDVIAKDLMAYYSYKGVEEQIEKHLDINWAFVEIPSDTEGGYKTAYEKIERLLGAVKNARSFKQFNYQLDNNGDIALGEKGRKCSLDGERNVKFYRRTEKEQDAKEGKRRNENEQSVYENKLFSNNGEVKVIDNTDESTFYFSKLQAGEGLSAVSMAKRLFKVKNRVKDFDSTADIALKHTLIQLDKYEEGKNILNAFNIIGDKMNAQLYYEENHTEQYYKKQGINIGCLQALKNKQKELKDFAKSKGLELTKYYAIIDFDGDNMGKWLSGDNINNPETNLKEFHQKLSCKLAAFATKAQGIVDKYGQTVYAGGDDFLGFVNLNYLFKAMQELRNAFAKDVNDSLHTELGYLKEKLSFSAGVCIAHYKEPLSMVLAKAADAQKTAKADKKGERNAFCIVASKHSGENHEAYFNWGTDCENVGHWDYIVKQLITENSFSNTFIKSLNIEFARLVNNKGELLVADNILKDEVERLTYRSCMFKRDFDKGETSDDFKKQKKKAAKDLTTNVMALLKVNNFNNLINALNICDFMHRLLSTTSEKQQLQTA